MAMIRMRRAGALSKGWIAWALALLLVMLSAGAAAGENLGPGGSRVIVGDEVKGSYRLLVTSSPNPATTGTVTFVVRVSEPQSGALVRDAEVKVALTNGSTSLEQAATHENAGNAVDYAAHIPVADAGSWNGAVRVTGAAGVSEVAFVQQVSTPRTLNMVILVGIPFAAILVVFGAMWFARNSSRKAEEGDRSMAQPQGK